MARDQLGIQVITPVYFGSRNVNLKPDKQIKTPADMAGIKLRMPPGEFWQFLGESIGANPTPVAYAEVYTALQSGAIDGQDNPLVAEQADEVRRGDDAVRADRPRHRLRRDGRSRTKMWDAMSPAQQAAFQAAAEKAIDDYTSKFNAQEKETSSSLQEGRQEGLHARPRRLPHLRAEEVRRQVRQATGRRARSSASTRCSREACRRSRMRVARPFGAGGEPEQIVRADARLSAGRWRRCDGHDGMARPAAGCGAARTTSPSR